MSITPAGVRLVNRANTAAETADAEFFGRLPDPAGFDASLLALDHLDSRFQQHRPGVVETSTD